MLIGITGGTGFIGRALVLRHLAEGDKVRLLSRRLKNDTLPKDVKCFYGDLTGPIASLIRFVDGVDILYHCAGEIRDKTKMHSVHVEGTKNLCAASNHKIGHWVQLSSVGTYGEHSSGVVTEQTPLKPTGTYETTKTESDLSVIQSSKEGAFTYSILRPSNVFGPEMTNRSIFQLITMIDKGLFFYIGAPCASANYIYVDNVVEGLIRCGKMPISRGGIYNLSDYCTIEEFVGIIADKLNRPAPAIRLPENLVRCVVKLCGKIPHFPLKESRVDALTIRSRYSIERIQRDLGYTHPVSIEDGLGRMVKNGNKNVKKKVCFDIAF